MRASVLNDPALLKRAGQFAWLSIDTDNPANAAVSEKLASEGVPVFAVIDSATEKVALSWYGSATAAQLVALMDDAGRVLAGGASGPNAILGRADEANARKNYTDAAAFYEQALKAGGPKWEKRPRVLESLIMAEALGHKNAECVQTALQEAPGMARDRSFVNVVYFGLNCAKPGTPELSAMEKLAEEAVKLADVLSDDISQLYGELAYHYREDDKDQAAAARTGNAWVAYLRGEMERAKTPDARLALALQLVSAANALHRPELAVPPMERAERELPGEYMPPRSLAGVYANMGRYDDAMAACGRALARSTADPKLRIYRMCGNILQQRGDAAGAKKMYEEGLAYARTFPADVGKAAREALEAALAKLP